VLQLQRQRLELDKRSETTTLLANRRIASGQTPAPAGGSA
jgi:hypothetical protein